MADETTPQATPAADAEAAPQPPAAKAPAKKEKPPALEDKPFSEFIEQHLLPSLAKALQDKGMGDVQLSFTEQPLNVFGWADKAPYWHVKGQWENGARQFNIAFTKDSISSPKLFYYADQGSQPSTIEQFMGDERKVTLDLLVLYTLQRLNGQKWLVRN